METVRSLPLPSHSPAASSSRAATMPSSYGQTPSRQPSQQTSGPVPLAHVGRPAPHPAMDGSPYKIRSAGTGGGGIVGNSSSSSSSGGSGGGLTLVPSSHLLQTTSHIGPATEPVTPPPPSAPPVQPQVSHSNLSQVARAHPYAAALPAAPLPSSTLRYTTGQPSSYTSSSGSIYSSSPTFSRTDGGGGGGGGGPAAPFPLRSPPGSGEFRRRLTLLPHSGLSPLDYAGGAAVLSGPGPGGGGSGGSGSMSASISRPYHVPGSLHSHLAYSTAPVDTYRESLMLPGLAPPVSGAPSSMGESPHKKLRIGEPLLMKATLAQPLRIDTRPISTMAPVPMPPMQLQRETQSAYIPQVEAISPTLPGDGDDLKRDDSPLRSTKDDLLQQITKVDREISKVENNITKLKKKQQDLEEAAKKPPPEHGELRTTGARGLKNQSVAQLIYAENRRKAAEAHKILAPLGPPVDLPLYHQPSDTAVYLRNRAQFLAFRPRLLKFLRRRQKEKEGRNRYLTVTYNKLMNEWAKRVGEMEKASNAGPAAPAIAAPGVPTVSTSSSSASASSASGSGSAAASASTAAPTPVNGKKKEREFYEKVFPELRKQREDRERFSRVGSRIKSDADLEEIMDGLQEQENEDKKMRSLAVVPPVLLDSRERRLCFDNRNGLVEDPMAEYRERPLLNVWTEQEKEIFREKYLQHPKNFVSAASCLERKSVAECVQFYYLSKKTVNYKQLLRKTKMKRNTRGAMQKPNAAAAAAAAAAQAAQAAAAAAAAQQAAQAAAAAAAAAATATSSSSSTSTSSSSNDAGVTTRLQREAQMRQDPTPPSSSSSSSQPTTSSSSSSTLTTASAPSGPGGNASATSGAAAVEADQALNDKSSKDEHSGSDSAEDDDEEEEEENNPNASNAVGTGGPHPCVVCKAVLEHHGQSRPLPKHQASQYGLQETDVSAEARVCSACRCRVVRRRYVQCPLPTCPTAKRRVKRLRPLPSKWNEQSPDVRLALESEFQIGPDISKCCSTCCNRISRKLAVLTGQASGVSSAEGNGGLAGQGDKALGGRTSGNSPALIRPEGSSPISSGEDELVVAEKAVGGRPDHHHPHQHLLHPMNHHAQPQQQLLQHPSVHQLLPPRPVMVVEPRTAPRIVQAGGAGADNSETDSADEVGASHAAAADNLPPNAVRNGSVAQEALTVHDLVSGVIESQLKRADSHALTTPLGVAGSPVYPPGPSESPTITSILKDSQRNYAVGRSSAPLAVVTNTAPTPPPRSVLMMPHPAEGKQQTILIVDSAAHPSRRTSPYPPGLIHPGMPPSIQPEVEYSASLPREGLAFRIHRDVVPVEGQTLDLSMPKKRDANPPPSLPPSHGGSSHSHGGSGGSQPSSYAPPPLAHSKPGVGKEHPGQAQHYQRNPPTVLLDQSYSAAGMRAPSYPPRSTPPSQQGASRGPPVGGGSIMQGTPLIQQSGSSSSLNSIPRTDGLLRPAVPGRDPSISGSITQGTPMVKDLDGRAGPLPHPAAAYESYYKGGQGGGGHPPQGSSSSIRMGDPKMTGPVYASDPQFVSREIILSDYLLSQQMANRNSGGGGGSGGSSGHPGRRDREPLPVTTASRPGERGGAPPLPSHPASLYQYRPPSPMYVQKLPYGLDPHHGYPPHSSSGPSGQPQHQLQRPPQQPTPPHQQQQQQQPQQRQSIIQRNSSVPASRQSDPRPSPPAPSPHGPPQQQQGRTSSPASGGGHLGSLGRPGASLAPVSISPRGDSIYVHDAFASLVNAAAAQPSLPVPGSDRDRDRRDVRDVRDLRDMRDMRDVRDIRDLRDVRDRERDRDRDKDPRQGQPGLIARPMHPDRRDDPALERLPHQYHRESPKMASGPPPSAQPPPPGSASGSSAVGGDSTLTAASLIDAIITHQINQTSNPTDLSGPGGGSSNSKSAVDSLFNRYRRSPLPDHRPPPTSSAPSAGSTKSEPQQRHPSDSDSAGQPPGPQSQRPPSSSPSVVPAPPPPVQHVPSTNKAAFTLGEHIESIIAKDFHQGAGHRPSDGHGGGSSSAAGQGSGGPPSEQDWEREWQRRQSESFKSRVPTSSASGPESAMINDFSKGRPPSAAVDFTAKSRAAGSESQSATDYSSRSTAADAAVAAAAVAAAAAAARGGGEPDPRQPAISPLDYVKKKIVEVMRTNSGDGPAGGQGQQPQDMAPPSSPARRCLSPAPSPNKRPRLADGQDDQPGQPSAQPPPPPTTQQQQQQQRGGPSPVVPHFLSGASYPTMAYPYTIPPNVPITSSGGSSVGGGGVGGSSVGPPGNHQQSVVVLSSQYEPLSDED